MPRGAGFWLRLNRRVVEAVRICLILASHVAIAFAPTRWLIAYLLRHQRRKLRRLGFEADFYLRQLRPHPRVLAACDPELHYLFLGWRVGRSPSRRSDQVFVSSRYPGFAGNPYLHIEPLLEPRNDLEALGRSSTPVPGPRGYALVFHHARGGGSTKCIGLYEQWLECEGLAPLRLRPVPRSDRLVVIQSSEGLKVHDLVDDLPAFLDAIAGQQIARIVVSHVVDFDPALVFDMLLAVAERLACPLDLLLHDYFAVCPRINLLDAAEQTCFTPPAVERCRVCIGAGGSDIRGVDPATWRESFVSLAAKANRVIVLSEDMWQRLSPCLPGPLTIWRPQTDMPIALTPQVVRDGECLRIAVAGALNVAKGSKVIAALGMAIKARKAPIAIRVFGGSPEHKLLAAADVPINGRYKEADLSHYLAGWGPHAALIPAIWPETWSFVLSEVLDMKLPVFSFAHGAQAERLKWIGRADHILPSELSRDPDALLDWLLAYRLEVINS